MENIGKSPRAEAGEHTNKGAFIQYLSHNISCLHSFTHNNREVDFTAARRGKGKTMTLFNPPSPGQLPLIRSGHTCDTNKPHNSPEGQTLSKKHHTEIANLPERLKTLSASTPSEGVKTLRVQLVKVLIYIQENIKDIPVGGRLKWFVTQWKEQGSHPVQLDLLRQGYRLLFKEDPKLSRTPCILS